MSYSHKTHLQPSDHRPSHTSAVASRNGDAEGGIPIDMPCILNSASPTADVEFVGSSFAMTPPPAATQSEPDELSSGGDGDGDGAEFQTLTDRDMQEAISRARGMLMNPGMLANLPDGGKKLESRLRRMKKELDWRRDAGTRKEAESRKWPVQSNTEHDPCIVDGADELDSNSSACKSRLKSCSPPSTKNYNKVKRAAFSKGLGSFSQDKYAGLKKERQISLSVDGTCLRKLCPKTSMGIRKEFRAVDLEGSDRKRSLPIKDDSFDVQRKLCSETSMGHQQKILAVDLKGADHNNCLHIEEDISGNSINRRGPSRHQDPSYMEFEKLQDVVLLDDEDTQPAKSVDGEIADKWDESKIYYPSRSDTGAVELTYSDIKYLEPEVYLKSPVINFYIQYLKKSTRRGDLYIFNTYFYSKLEEALSRTCDLDSQFSKLRRWWKGVDIFKKAYIILPTHGKMHWSLIIVCMPGKETVSGPIILHLDSLGLHSSVERFDKIERYLQAEWRHVQKDASYDIPFSKKIWSHLSRTIDKVKIEVPRQQNEYDCGIFMLYYVELFIREAPERLTRESLDMFGRKWFKPEEAFWLRGKIQVLLSDVFESAQSEEGASRSVTF